MVLMYKLVGLMSSIIKKAPTSLRPHFHPFRSVLIGQLVGDFLWAKLNPKHWLMAKHTTDSIFHCCMNSFIKM